MPRCAGRRPHDPDLRNSFRDTARARSRSSRRDRRSLRRLNQRRFDESGIELAIYRGKVSGQLRIQDHVYSLEDFGGVYTRLMNDQLLPELRHEPAGSVQRQSCRALHETLMRWLEITSARVVNRSAPQASNFSKPYQAQLIRTHGFSIPETLITNRPELVREFVARHKRVVYKSISGVRSIVRRAKSTDLWPSSIEFGWCPVQFQEYIDGANVRVHIGRKMKLFATAVRQWPRRTTGTRNGRIPTTVLHPTRDFGRARKRHCRLTGGCCFGLPLAGIDLKITPAGEAFCLEVNPSPAFSYYELEAGQPISLAVARYIARR